MSNNVLFCVVLFGEASLGCWLSIALPGLVQAALTALAIL